jgi:hypothetical protein
LGFSRRRLYHGLTRGKSSRRLWLPYRVSPVHHREPGRDPLGSRWSTPSEVSSPSAFLNHEEPLSPAGSHPGGCVASSGFRTLTTPAPLMASRAYSIPVPLMGFYPSRLFSSPGAVRPLGRRAPQGFSSSLARRGRPSRDQRTKRSTSAGPGISRVAAVNASLGFSASRLLVLGSEERSSRSFIPSRAFPARPQADQAAGASGYSLPRTQPVSLEID